MIRIWQIVFFLFFTFHLGNLFAQNTSKAIKLTEKAEEAVKVREFSEAKDLLRKAIRVDASYGKAYLRLASIYNVYQQKDSALLYYNRYSEVVPPERVSQVLWERIAEMNFEHGDYTKASAAIHHVQNPDSLLSASIIFSEESISANQSISLETLPKSVNQYQLQYFPVLTVDENTIIYTKRDANHPSADEDIVVSTKIQGNWIPAQPISKNINTRYNEGACTISADGRTLIFTSCEGRPSFGSCDLYISFKEGAEWSKPENLGSIVNSKYWDSQPALSADGRTLLFSSNRPGGVGKRDLWQTRLGKSGWTEPVNLGKKVNTKEDETTPYLHANGELVFFSSSGHIGLGGFDLYASQFEQGEWQTPINLGYPLNSSAHELSLFINAEGTRGYYAIEETDARRMVSSEIVKFRIPFDSLIKHRASYVTGKVLDAESGEPIGAKLHMEDLKDSTNVFYASSDSLTGRYFLVLVADEEYGVFVQKSGYLFEDFTFEVQESTSLKPDTLDILLRPINNGVWLNLENIYFEVDDFHLQRKSRSELREIINYLQINPKLQFVIEGHTDNTGQEVHNLELSEKRARTVYDYLLKGGVDSSRMSYKGKGSKEPIADNNSEEGRKMNRRITFRVNAND